MLNDDIDVAINASENKIVENTPGMHWCKRDDLWTLSGFRQDEFNPKRTKIIDEMENLWKELYNDLTNGKNTCPRPIYLNNVTNVLTLIGLTESAKRDTGETSTSISHTSLGDDGTAATQNDTDLTSEISGGTPTYARKAFSSDGQASVVNQTAKYGMLWDDTDLDVTPSVDIKEAGLHWHLSDASKCHAHVAFTTFSFATGDLFVVQINELMENG